MKILIVDDEFIGRRILTSYLSKYGTCDMASNGLEAIEAFKLAYEEGEPYNLICLDIVMPEINGQDVLKQIREYENSMGIYGLDQAVIIMTTALGDFENIKKSALSKCEGYLVKPIDKEKLFDIVDSYQFNC
ncbi:response regulator [Clostridium sp.]|uniref:response regulator n=1 Tax=Clostridium sp. TaxID=1506 RepID=UPI0026119A3F|nr:response regulator [Clostridium sp.]